MKTITLFTALLLTGLSAGFFYAWSVSVIPGTKRIADPAYLEAMQSINRAVLNPWFFLIFFGSLASMGISTIQQINSGTAFWLILLAAVTYLIGTFGITGLGNVPLNNELDALDLKSLTAEQAQKWREYFETKWNRLHSIRTVFAVASFILSLASLMFHTQNFKS